MKEADRYWIARELDSMDALVESYLAAVDPVEREYETYRLEFELPTFTYLRRTYTLFYPETADDLAESVT